MSEAKRLSWHGQPGQSPQVAPGPRGAFLLTQLPGGAWTVSYGREHRSPFTEAQAKAAAEEWNREEQEDEEREAVGVEGPRWVREGPTSWVYEDPKTGGVFARVEEYGWGFEAEVDYVDRGKPRRVRATAQTLLEVCEWVQVRVGALRKLSDEEAEGLTRAWERLQREVVRDPREGPPAVYAEGLGGDSERVSEGGEV